MTTPAEDFAGIIRGALGDREAHADTAPEDTGPRAPRPNAAQGTSDGTAPAPSPGDLFAELVTGRPHTNPNSVPGDRRAQTAAQAGQHAGWRSE